MKEITKGETPCLECGDLFEYVEETEDKTGAKVYCRKCHTFKGVYLLEDKKPSTQEVQKAVKEIDAEEENRVDYI